MKKCENCKFSDTLYPPSIYKCRLKKITVSYKDSCEKYEVKDASKDFITDFFNNNIFKDKK